MAAIVIALVPPLRRGLIRWWLNALQLAGFPRRKYARWFVQTWGVYENPYLDDRENLDLSNTYVPLSFRSDEAGQETLNVAAAVLADKGTGNLIIEGAPGSGKSTLLKSLGVAVLQDSRALKLQRPAVPFLIQLRKLARDGTGEMPISDYIINEILVSGAGMKSEHAWKFFRYALAKDQVILMLDGLDEVTTSRYLAVHEAVYGFVNDHRPSCQSYRARVIITCRKQNFLSLRDEWIPAIASGACSLAPLRNSEIFSYLNKLRPKFKNASGPESFLQAVRASGTLDLHRAPLILAMSVGLYARKEYFEIPSSIASLYNKMIEEMLDRHRFRRDPGGAALEFKMADKYRFLQEFAFDSARGRSGFDEFTKAELVSCARSLASDLDAVSEPHAFVDEIIQRSGLLANIGEAGRYVFAHRSIQELLAAEEARSTNSDLFLLEKANDPEWRQVIQFYSAGLNQRHVNEFLSQLSQYNGELAGHCLANAKASNGVAAAVLEALGPLDRIRLSALAAATMSPRIPIQRMAIDRLVRALSSPDSPLSALTGDVETMLPLLNSLAGTNAAQIAGLVPQLIKHVPDDPRLTEPLWRCLSAPGIDERRPESCAIVERLLMIATSLDGFEELARQERYTWEFLTKYLHQSYPFKYGLDLDHNLVTLLAWAEYLKVVPAGLNRYFDAKVAGCLDRIEADGNRTIAFSLFWPSTVFSSAVCIAALSSAAALVLVDPLDLLRPFGGWTLALIAAAALAPLAIFFFVNRVGGRFSGESGAKRILGLNEDPKDVSHIMEVVRNRAPGWLRIPVGIVGLVVLPLAVAVACLPLLGNSLMLYVAVTLAGGLIYWAPSLDPFARTRRFYLYRPSGYIDIYDDPRSRHWIVKTRSRVNL